MICNSLANRRLIAESAFSNLQSVEMRRRLTTQVFGKKLYAEELADYVLCIGGEEEYTILLFQCPFARMIRAIEGISSVNTTSTRAFWDPFQQANWRQKEEGGKILAV